MFVLYSFAVFGVQGDAHVTIFARSYHIARGLVIDAFASWHYFTNDQVLFSLVGKFVIETHDGSLFDGSNVVFGFLKFVT